MSSTMVMFEGQGSSVYYRPMKRRLTLQGGFEERNEFWIIIPGAGECLD